MSNWEKFDGVVRNLFESDAKIKIVEINPLLFQIKIFNAYEKCMDTFRFLNFKCKAENEYVNRL